MKNLFSLLVLVALSVLLCATNVAAALYGDWDDEEQHVLALVNHQRDLNGLSHLVADNRLHAAADLHSQDMAENDYFDHDSKDGAEFYKRIKAQGYDYKASGENIAAGYSNAYAVMYGTDDLSLLSAFDVGLGKGGFSNWEEVGQGWSGTDWDAWYVERKRNGGWMGSKGHRENILEQAFTDIGVGYDYLASDTGDLQYNHYWTQDFASGDTAPVPIPPSILLFGSGIFWIMGVFRIKR